MRPPKLKLKFHTSLSVTVHRVKMINTLLLLKYFWSLQYIMFCTSQAEVEEKADL